MNIVSLILKLFSNTYFISFLAVITCSFFYYLKGDFKWQRKIVWMTYSLLFIGILTIFIKGEAYRIHQPRVWDFTAFYLYGKVAALGYNFYIPENFSMVFNGLNLPFQASQLTHFMESLVDVGFPYPPPTMLYFMPLGFLTYETALVIWTLFILLFLFADIYLIYNQFFSEYKFYGIILITILFLIYPMVKFTMYCAQTNFIVLFFLLLMKRYSNHKFAGILLALAFLTKPFMLIFGLYFVLSGKWKAITYFIISGIILSAISLIVFGSDTFVSYFLNNATQRIPAWQYSEDVNQSLHAVLLRTNLITLDKPLIYLIISATLLGMTILFSRYLLKRNMNDNVWALLLLVGLLVYPGTLNYYGVVLLFIIFQFFKQEQPLGLPMAYTIPIIGILYYLNSVSVFACICLLLIIVIFKTLLQIKQMNLAVNPEITRQWQ